MRSVLEMVPPPVNMLHVDLDWLSWMLIKKDFAMVHEVWDYVNPDLDPDAGVKRFPRSLPSRYLQTEKVTTKPWRNTRRLA